MAVKVLGSDNTGNLSDVLRGINYTALMKQRGVNIRAINVSIGLRSRASGEAAQILGLLVQFLEQEGTLIILAAGNSHGDVDDIIPDQDIPLTDSTRKNIIVVAASERGGGRSATSNYGQTTVDLAAPGRDIYSPRSRIHTLGTAQTRSDGILFDSTEVPRIPSASAGWLIGSADASLGVIDAVRPTGEVWTNALISATEEFTLGGESELVNCGLDSSLPMPAGQSELRYGPFDLTTFPSTQSDLFVNFKLRYDLSDTLGFENAARCFSLQARNGNTVWSTLRRFNGSSDWQEFNLLVPAHFHGLPAVEFRFVLSAVSLLPDSVLGINLVRLGVVYLDDIGIGRAEDATAPYAPVNGTSFAAPFVAGAVALLASHRPDLDYLRIRRAILDNVRRTPVWEPLVASGGILDLAAALASVSTPGLTVMPPRLVFTPGLPTTLTVVLTREPGAGGGQREVIVQLGTPEINAQPPTLTFTAENWHIPQPVAVTVADTRPIEIPRTTLRISVAPEGSDSAYQDAGADIVLDVLAVNRIRLNPGVIALGEAVIATVELNAPTQVPIAVTLTLTVEEPAYSTVVWGRIEHNQRTVAFNLLPSPVLVANVSAQISLVAIRTDTGTPLDLPSLPTLRIVTGPLLRLRLRAFLEGALQ